MNDILDSSPSKHIKYRYRALTTYFLFLGTSIGLHFLLHISTIIIGIILSIHTCMILVLLTRLSQFAITTITSKEVSKSRLRRWGHPIYSLIFWVILIALITLFLALSLFVSGNRSLYRTFIESLFFVPVTATLVLALIAIVTATFMVGREIDASLNNHKSKSIRAFIITFTAIPILIGLMILGLPIGMLLSILISGLLSLHVFLSFHLLQYL